MLPRTHKNLTMGEVFGDLLRQKCYITGEVGDFVWWSDSKYHSEASKSIQPSKSCFLRTSVWDYDKVSGSDLICGKAVLQYNSKSMMMHWQELDWKSSLPWFSCGSWKCMHACWYLNWTCVSCQIYMLSIESGVVSKIPRLNTPIFLNLCHDHVCSLILIQPHINQI